MRITVTLLTLFFSSVLLNAQTADVTTGCAPLQVKFTPPSGATSFFWDFKDGGTSVLSSPTNIFTTPGTYAVEFRNSSGGQVVGTVNITVYPKPQPSITAIPESGCVPLLVQFKDTTQLAGDIKIQSYSWVFGDGQSGSGQSVSHVYNTAGAFTISLEIKTNYSTCNVTQVFQDKVKTGVKPLTGFTTSPSPAESCAPPLAVSFNNTTLGGAGTLSFLWDFGNGNTATQSIPQPQTYTQNGNYTVVLTATDQFGCSATATTTVNIGPPLVAFSLPDTVCVGDSTKIINTSTPGTYAWNFGPNAIPTTSTKLSPYVTFTAPGLQTITLTVTTAAGCTNTGTKKVYADQANAAFTVSPAYSCSDPTLFSFNAPAGNTVKWEWLFSDGSKANIKNPTYLWTTPDTTGYSRRGLYLDTVLLKVTTAAGCTAEWTRVDTIWRPNARFFPNVTHGCAPLEVTFADSSISKENIALWTWMFDDGSLPLVKNTNTPVTHTFNTPGEYKVRLAIRNSAGCIDTSYVVLIEVGEPIPGDFVADKLEICPGDSIHLSSLTNDPRIDAWHFSTDNNRSWHCFQEKDVTWTFGTETGPMDVSLTTEYNGCFTTVTKEDYVLVKGPIAELHYKTTCDNTLNFEFTNLSHDATNTMCFFGDGDSSALNMVTSHLYKAPGVYTVILRAQNPASGCPASYDTATVYPTILKAVFNLPDTICGGKPQVLDGSKSLGVNATCYKGYTWYFDFQRPIRTDRDTLSYTFGPSGTHTVWLEVEDINGCKDTLRDDITIYNREPKIKVSDDNICIPGTVLFTDLSTADAPIVSWEWNFGDGSKSTDVNPTHTYTTPPLNGQSFIVTLKIEDDKGCPGFTGAEIKVYKPTSNIFTVPQPAWICAGQNVVFTATNYTAGGSSLNWKWSFPDGATATGQSTNQTFNKEGQFLVKMVYTEIASGCKDSTTAPVRVQVPPQAMFTTTVDNQSIICYPQNIKFTNASITNYPPLSIQWDLGNGQMPTGDEVYTVFPKGTYTVKMIASTPYGCKDTTERSFTVVGPEGNFSLDKNFICKGDAITFTLKDTASISSWSWNFGDGTTADNKNPITHSFTALPPSGTLPIKLVLKGEDDACSITVEQPISFSVVNADFQTAQTTICAGAPLQFLNTSASGDAASWTFGDGGTSNALNPEHTYNTQGSYNVTLIATDLPLGCMDTITKPVTVTGIPGLETFGDMICPGDTALIGVQPQLPNATYIWSPANLVLPPKDGAIVEAIPTQTTTFSVTVIDAQGCKDVKTAVVEIPTAYNGAQNLDTIVTKGSPITLPVQYDPDYIFNWSPKPGFTDYPPQFNAPDSSRHDTLRVTDLAGCTERVFVFNVLVVPEDVKAPNAFTPNNDGDNDAFHLLAFGEESLVQILSLKVYNRWGQKVFEGRGQLPDVAWDGKTDGEEAPSDVYAWTAEVQFATGKKMTLKGDVTLLR